MEELPVYSAQGIFYAFIGCIALAVAWFAGRASAQRPLAAFNQAVDRWRKGDLQTRIQVFDPHTPIGRLSFAFNDMAAKLSLREAERESVLRVLREGEERLQIAQDVAGLGIWDWDHLTGEISWSAQMFQLVGLDPATADANLSLVWRELIHPEDRAWMEQEVRRFSRTLEPLAAEYRIIREDGSVRWLLMRGQSLPDPSGKPVRTVIVNLDVTSSKDSEVRERFLLALSDKIRDPDRPDEILMMVAEALGSHLGVNRVGYGDVDDTTMVLSTLVDWHTEDAPDVSGRYPLRSFGPALCGDLRSGRAAVFDDALSDPRAEGHYAAYAALDCIASISVPLVKEGQLRAALYIHSGTPRRWTQSEIELVRDVAERTWAAVERAKSDARRRLLINELNHRVKNTLATVQSIAAQSFKAGEPKLARETFEARLFALSKTHDVLTRENWEKVNLHDIAEEAMAPYRREQVERFVIDGPALHVPPRIALPLAMALHELSTNAVKYGAFSADSGRVAIHWDLIEGWDEKTLVLQWQETGGPLVRTPTRKGFGSRLIERSLSRELSGKVVLDYRASGLMCTISLPLPMAQESLARAASFG
ncbi:HWE histidine kinase domain-containing protein [Microvirga rosea]|uniref:HWE histidine kinase domain-containing protein n=1 Tax=Microvirga rosea TaxID=2715425 RepID=UPI001D0A5E67|nr:HWE histidine kinase domain-containing protein [Microvirga rosea]MCB8822566.1 PAS domain-containing protein [Microvirga rosea]